MAAEWVGGDDITSHGEAVLIAPQGANTIWGFVDTNPNGAFDGGDRTVFVATLTGTNDSTFTFTLLDNLDHHTVAGADHVETVRAIDLSNKIQAIDNDGDPFNIQNTAINVIDDVPDAVGDIRHRLGRDCGPRATWC